MRKTILIILLSTICFSGWSQQPGIQLNPADTNTIQLIPANIHISGIYHHTLVSTTPSKQRTLYHSPFNIQDELGFFCKWELRQDKKYKQSVRFRLGSYDYVNHLEGK